MASSTTNLDTISSSQSQKEVTANALFDAASPATLFGRRATTTTALTWGFYGGAMLVDGVLTAIANGTVALTASLTNYVEATAAGVVSANTSGFTAGRIPLYTIVAGAATVTSYTDNRSWVAPDYLSQSCSVAVTTADVTLSAAQARCSRVTTTGTLTGNRSLVMPNAGRWLVKNDCAGAYALTVKTSAGSGIVVAAGAFAICEADGTNVVSASFCAPSFVPSGSAVPTNGIYLPAANTLGFATASTAAKAAIDSGGRLLIGATAGLSGISGQTENFQVVGNDGASSALAFHRHDASAQPAQFRFYKSRGTPAAFSVVSNGDALLRLTAHGYDSAAWQVAGYLQMSVDDAAVGSGKMGGKFEVFTTAAGGTTTAIKLTVDNVGHTTPGSDNAQNFGSGAYRWKELFCANGTINTSDARGKTPLRAMLPSEISAATALAREIGTFQFLDAVQAKGAEKARRHAGLTVQRAIEIMQDAGLDPFAYGFICYDAWPAREWEDGSAPAGDAYGFRSTELLLFIARGFEARISALEAKV